LVLEKIRNNGEIEHAFFSIKTLIVTTMFYRFGQVTAELFIRPRHMFDILGKRNAVDVLAGCMQRTKQGYWTINLDCCCGI